MMHRQTIWKGLALAGTILLASPPTLSSENSVTPDVLLQDSLNLSCISYRVSGMCFWLKCTPFGCYIRTSPQVEHYNPDVVMEVTNTDRLPMKWLTGPIDSVTNGISSGLFGMILGQRRKEVESVVSYQFHDVNEIGNPILPVYNGTVGNMMSLVNWCGSKVTPFRPYFNTKVDPDWRLGIAEALLTIPNLNQNIGSIKDKWAPVYPRTGAVVHSDLYRTSAGVAFRAGHITTRSTQPHIYSKLPTESTGGKTWGPGPLELDDEESRPMNKWQMNYPIGERSGCYLFPEEMEEDEETGEYPTVESELDNYVWTMWRKYKCCQRKGSFIKAVEW